MRPYLGNRIGLAVTGTVLVCAGLYAFLRGRGDLPGQAPGARLVPRGFHGWPAAHPLPGWLVAVLLVALTLLSVRWLLHALGWGRWGRRTGTGTAMLGVALKEVEGLTRVRVRYVRHERLRIGVGCAPATDVGKLVSRLNKDAVGKVRRALGEVELGVTVRLHVRRR